MLGCLKFTIDECLRLRAHTNFMHIHVPQRNDKRQLIVESLTTM